MIFALKSIFYLILILKHFLNHYKIDFNFIWQSLKTNRCTMNKLERVPAT